MGDFGVSPNFGGDFGILGGLSGTPGLVLGSQGGILGVPCGVGDLLGEFWVCVVGSDLGFTSFSSSAGVERRLGYLKEKLQVGGLVLGPVYPQKSPEAKIPPLKELDIALGTMQDFSALVQAAKDKGGLGAPQNWGGPQNGGGGTGRNPRILGEMLDMGWGKMESLNLGEGQHRIEGGGEPQNLRGTKLMGGDTPKIRGEMQWGPQFGGSHGWVFERQEEPPKRGIPHNGGGFIVWGEGFVMLEGFWGALTPPFPLSQG